MKNNYFYIIIAVLLLITMNSYSQETGGIKGIVRDSATGETIPFANVFVIDQNLGMNANMNGLFIIKGIKAGNITIQVTAVGYQKLVKNVKLKNNDFMSLPIALASVPVELGSVTSESERMSSTSLANISVQTIDQKELKSIPIAIERDVMKTLKVLPGVSSASDVTGQLYVRGGASDQNMFYCDNLKIANPFHAMGLFGIFNGDIVKSSDVITGGFDPEYGGRLSSVIKINTRDGNRNENKLKFNVGVLSGSASAEGPLATGSYLLSYRRSYLDDIVQKILDNDVSLSFDDFFGKYSIDIGSEGRGVISVITSSDDVDRLRDTDPSYKWRNLSVGASIESFVSNVYVSWTAAYSSFSMEENYINSNYGTNSNSSYNSISFNGKIDYQFAFNDVITIGLDLDLSSIKNAFTNSYGFLLKSSDNVPIMAFFTKYKLGFIKNFQLDAGFRQTVVGFDNQSLSLFEPRFNARYNISQDIAIKSSYTRMHQYLISNVDEDEFIPLYEAWICLKNPTDALGRFQITDKSLFPERAEQYVLGLDTRIFGRYKFVLQGYIKDIKDFIGYNMNRSNAADPEYVTGNGNSKGLEVFFKFDYRDFYCWLTYNLGWVEKNNNGVKYAPRYDKRHNLSVICGYTLPYDIRMGVSWDYSTGTPFTPLKYSFFQPSTDNIADKPGYSSAESYIYFGEKNSRRLSSYHKLDLNFSRYFTIWKLPKAEISVNITNLYDRENIFYYNMKTGERMDMLRFMVTGSLGIEI